METAWGMIMAALTLFGMLGLWIAAETTADASSVETSAPSKPAATADVEVRKAA